MGAGADSTSSFTSAVPGRQTSTALAAASDRSTMRSSINGPRSVMRTMADVSGGDVGDAHPRVQRQGAMRRGHRILVVDLAIGALVLVVRRPVPAGQPGLDVDGLGVAQIWRSGVCRRRLRRCDAGRRRNFLVCAVLCPPQAERRRSAQAMSEAAVRRADLAGALADCQMPGAKCCLIPCACSNPCGRRPGPASRWRSAGHWSSASG